MLKLHNDVNLFTVNIALNDDFEGGGLFYHKNDDSYYEGDNPLPRFPEEKLDYEYLEKITRENSSEIVFPEVKTGNLLIHNHTLFHAIAPIKNGTRYSLIFFYDMHHPDVKRHFPEEFEVLVDNGFDFPIDLYVVDNQSVERSLVLVMEDITEKTFNFEGMPGQLYEVFDRGTGKLVHSFDIYKDNEEGEEYVVYIGFTEDEENGRRGKLGKVGSAISSIRFSKSFHTKQKLTRSLTSAHLVPYRTTRRTSQPGSKTILPFQSRCIGLILIRRIASANCLRNCFQSTSTLVLVMGTNSKL